MQVVVEIDDNLYTRLFDNGDECVTDMRRACVAIRKGTPLPKGHGKLIDAGELISHLKAHKSLLIRHYADECGNTPFEINSRINQILSCIDDIKNAPTIIEADRAESEDEE